MKRLAFALFALLSIIAVPFLSATQFQSVTTYPVSGLWSLQVAFGDFNHDGHADMAVVMGTGVLNSQALVIFLNNGDGTFTNAGSYAPSGSPDATAVGDFNADGKLDVVVASGNNEVNGYVQVFIGKGDGTFNTGSTYTTGANPLSVAVADFNGDGKLDVATSNSVGIVSILLGNGDGTFQTAVNYSVGAASGLLTIGDFNGDHHPDIAVSSDNPDGGVYVMLGNGDGSFRAPVTYSTGGFDEFGITTADFNGDGKLDLAVGNIVNVDGTYVNYIAILLGNGDGTFQSPQTMPVDIYSHEMHSADLNGDGKADLVFSNVTGFAVALGKGDGTFQSPVYYSGMIDSAGVTVGDLNGDNKLDLALTNFEGVSVVFGFGDGTFPAPLLYNSGTYTPGVVAADFNNDGFTDVAFSTGILLGNGDGTFVNGAAYSAGSALAGAFADFNRDGSLDLAWANGIPKGTVYTQLGNGNGTFQTPRNNPAHKDPFSVVAADFNNDGLPDLATANWNSHDFSILIGKGDGTFNPAVNYSGVSYPYGLAAADFNGDGNVDLAVASTSGYVAVLLGNGDGTFKAQVNYPVAGAWAIALGDVNGDGKLDVVVSGFGNLSTLLGNGDGTFQPTIDSTGVNPLHVALADFNGDGKLDAVTVPWPSFGDSLPIAVHFGNGDGTFQPAILYSGGYYPINVAIGDFNGDGAPDLAFGGNYSGTTILLNTGGTFLTLTSSPNPSTLQQNVTFTVTVTASEKGQPLPSGTVTFKDGTTTLGSATLSNGVGTFVKSFSTSGQHQITPIYSGDSNFNPKTGTVLVQTVQAPTVTLSPNSLNFGSQKVGTTSGPMTAKLTNRGAGTLLISSIIPKGSDFTLTTNCGSSLGQNQSCSLTVKFTPSKTGLRTGTITINDNATNSPQVVKLSGTGT